MKVLKCKHCGNIVEVIKDSKVKIVCCGEPMEELVPGTVDAAREKHVPEVEINGNVVRVKVGEVTHPMLDVHYIEWIAIETNKGVHRVNLKPGEDPVATFVLADGEVFVSAYEHCNLHGLWKR